MTSRLPECFCSPTGQEIPGDLPADQVPQMIVITFDDAVNHNNYEEIQRFLNSNLKNPNSCDIKATFFVSHQYNNYSMVQVPQSVSLLKAGCMNVAGAAQERSRDRDPLHHSRE